MFNLDSVIKAISSMARPAASLAMNQAQRNEAVIKILKDFGFDPVQPPKDVDGVYAYTLVEYGVGKPETILNLWREKEIKKAFWDAYRSKSPLWFLRKVEHFLEWNILGDEIRAAKIDIRPELEEFGKAFITVARRTGAGEFQPYPDWTVDKVPAEFKALIEDKTRTFCGRGFVFDAFDNFLKEKPCGYFTVVGEPGMGKSAISAKYVLEHKSPCYFNIRAEGRNKPDRFLESIRQQLMKRYPLLNAETDELPALLEKASKELAGDERLVIVVDALDEVEQPGDDKNLLYLPGMLPKRVYFLLTRRPYTPENKRLTVSAPVGELDLRKFPDLSREDVKEYIRFFRDKSEQKDDLKKWIKDRQIAPEAFVEQVAAKSQSNFLYLRYVLPEIARGFYNDLTLEQLPAGLQDYYQSYWGRMNMDDASKKAKAIVLFILVEIGTPVPCEMIAKIADRDECDVREVLLDEWFEYLKEQEIQGETCYTIYHTSFLDFLKSKRELDSKRKLFVEVNRRIAEYLEKEMGQDGEIG
ncbi:AAA family ATPase [Kamptonema formosum]|uniref:AAA family ATPase n=1 Tax=Kamptonema formosum TaxID=331992 RepID=UPI0003657A16|nr:AAA family ATPase [Oscillatoria sp. PCC 10802]